MEMATGGRLTWGHSVPLVLLEALQRVHSRLQPARGHAQPHGAVAGFWNTRPRGETAPCTGWRGHSLRPLRDCDERGSPGCPHF